MLEGQACSGLRREGSAGGVNPLEARRTLLLRLRPEAGDETAQGEGRILEGSLDPPSNPCSSSESPSEGVPGRFSRRSPSWMATRPDDTPGLGECDPKAAAVSEVLRKNLIISEGFICEEGRFSSNGGDGDVLEMLLLLRLVALQVGDRQPLWGSSEPVLDERELVDVTGEVDSRDRRGRVEFRPSLRRPPAECEDKGEVPDCCWALRKGSDLKRLLHRNSSPLPSSGVKMMSGNTSGEDALWKSSSSMVGGRMAMADDTE